jgi:hypothetical protein
MSLTSLHRGTQSHTDELHHFPHRHLDHHPHGCYWVTGAWWPDDGVRSRDLRGRMLSPHKCDMLVALPRSLVRVDTFAMSWSSWWMGCLLVYAFMALAMRPTLVAFFAMGKRETETISASQGDRAKFVNGIDTSCPGQMVKKASVYLISRDG